MTEADVVLDVVEAIAARNGSDHLQVLLEIADRAKKQRLLEEKREREHLNLIVKSDDLIPPKRFLKKFKEQQVLAEKITLNLKRRP